MPVSAPSRTAPAAAMALAAWPAEIIEVAALRSAAHAPQRFGAACGEPLPAFGRVTLDSAHLALSVRPARWLLVAALPPGIPGSRAARWRQGCAASAAVTELSSALSAFLVAGSQVTEMLARGCRLDLHPQVFPPGTAAATVMVQVSVILAALPHGMLLLTPSSTAQHFAEWLETAARPFGRSQTVQIQELFSGAPAARHS
jgi:heterotetrameric sarcosine oxidase gamma subunit